MDKLPRNIYPKKIEKSNTSQNLQLIYFKDYSKSILSNPPCIILIKRDVVYRS